MKRSILLAAVSLLLFPGVAFSQTGFGGSSNSGSGGATHQNRPQGGKGEDSAHFQTRKNEILKRIGDRISELQQRQSCVQSASNREALMSCMPPRREQR